MLPRKNTSGRGGRPSLVGIGVEELDLAEDEEVVAHRVHLLDGAVDPRDRTIEDR